MPLLSGLEKTNSTTPQGKNVVETTSTDFRDWQNLRKRSTMKRKIDPAAMQKKK